MKRVYIFLLSAFLPLVLLAQNVTTASPYSRYGYGELQSMGVGAARAMGGIGYGIRDHRIINPMNPASYSSIDSLTFMLNFAGSGTVNGVSSGSEIYNQFRGRVDYVAIQIPIYKFIAFSIGVIPFSSVGYKYASTYDLKDYSKSEGTINVKQTYEGTGGFTQAYAGLSFNILDRVAVGANARFMFGKVTHSRWVEFPNESFHVGTLQTHYMYSTSWLCDVGVQYTQPLGGKNTLVIGGAYSFKLPMNIKSQITTYTNKEDVDNTKYDFDYPQSVGVGLSYRMGETLLAGVDFEWRDFSNARYYGVTDTLLTTYKIALGAEYVYKPGSKKYADNIRYRIGANFSPSYVKINNNRYMEFAITAGVGLPLFNNLTTINVFVEYGHRGGLKTVGLVEDYFTFGLDIALNERWFVKRRLN